MATTAVNISQPANTGMNQVPPEIMTVMSLRGIYRAAGNRATFPDDSLKTIADIRTDLPAAAANGDGLQKINNWRSGSGSGSGSGGGERHGGSKMPARQGAMTSEGRYSNQQHVARNPSSAFGGRGERSGHGGSGERSGEARQGHGGSEARQGHGYGEARGEARSGHGEARSGGSRYGHSSKTEPQQQQNTFGPARFKNSSFQQTAHQQQHAPVPQSQSVMTVSGVPTTPSGTSPAVPLVSPTQAAATPAPATTVPATAPSRYVSKFKNSSQAVEKTIVNTLIRGKLNKFSQENYEDIKEFLMVILETGDEDPNFLSDFMKLIFTKAAEEEIYCPLYAQLLNDLSTRFPYLLEEMATLYKRFMGIFEEVCEKSVENYTDLLERNKEKRYRTGYSQFIGELFKLGIIDHSSFMDTCALIVNQLRVLIDQADKLNTVEEYVGCLGKIMAGIKGDVPEEIKELVSTLADLTVRGVVKPSFSPKVRFAIMDVINIK